MPDPDAWLERSRLGARIGGAAGRRPMTSRPWRPVAAVALWAHDHHALLGSRTRRSRTAGLDRRHAGPAGGVIGRDAAGAPDGVLYEAADPRVVTVHVPPLAPDGPRARRSWRSRMSCCALGVVAVHDPGDVSPRPGPRVLVPGLRPPVGDAAACRSASTPRSATTPSTTALAGGLRSGDVLGADPDGRARIGWQKCFADGSLGSRTAALLADIEPEPDRPLPPERRGAASG